MSRSFGNWNSIFVASLPLLLKCMSTAIGALPNGAGENSKGKEASDVGSRVICVARLYRSSTRLRRVERNRLMSRSENCCQRRQSAPRLAGTVEAERPDSMSSTEVRCGATRSRLAAASSGSCLSEGSVNFQPPQPRSCGTAEPQSTESREKASSRSHTSRGPCGGGGSEAAAADGTSAIEDVDEGEGSGAAALAESGAAEPPSCSAACCTERMADSRAFTA